MEVFFGSLAAIAASKLEMALSLIAQASAGVLPYEMQDVRGIALMAKLLTSFAPARYAIERVHCARC